MPPGDTVGNPATHSEPDSTTCFVLVEPSHAGNVGAVARAMKVMGFSALKLVNPRWPDVLMREETIARASGAVDVLQRAEVVGSLAQALRASTHACATAMTPRDFGPPTAAPRQHLPPLAVQGQHVAFVFGPERTGLSNDDVYRCDACLSIPTDPTYGSLNLAQAVQLIAYEWRQALGGFDVQARTAAVPLANGAALDGLMSHWQGVLQDSGFLDPASPKKLLPRLRRMALRADLTAEDVHILRGIARALSTRR